MAAAVSSSQVLTANLNYFLDKDSNGVDARVFYPGTAGDKRRPRDTQPVQVTNMRDKGFTLDKNGFQLVSHVSREKTFDNEERVKTEVYDETSELLKKVTGATIVRPFSHIIRRVATQKTMELAKGLRDDEVVPVMSPATYVHVDQSYDGAVQVLEDNLEPEDAERMAKSRWGIINVWRPIVGPVKREPIAVSDSTTIPESDLREVRALLPTQKYLEGGTLENLSKGPGFNYWMLAANPQHRWYYAPEMDVDETLMIKCFDSKKDGRSRCAPHTAFKSPLDEGPPRQSIEVRCLLGWEDQEVE